MAHPRIAPDRQFRWSARVDVEPGLNKHARNVAQYHETVIFDVRHLVGVGSQGARNTDHIVVAAEERQPLRVRIRQDLEAVVLQVDVLGVPVIREPGRGQLLTFDVVVKGERTSPNWMRHRRIERVRRNRRDARRFPVEQRQGRREDLIGHIAPGHLVDRLGVGHCLAERHRALVRRRLDALLLDIDDPVHVGLNRGGVNG